jgi:hypothetical protein
MRHRGEQAERYYRSNLSLGAGVEAVERLLEDIAQRKTQRSVRYRRQGALAS